MKYLFSIAILHMSLTLWGQAFIEGIMVDSAKQKPISGVHVSSGGKQLATSNLKGKFIIQSPKKSGYVLIEFSHLSYKPLSRWVKVKKGDTTQLSIVLAQQQYMLPEFRAFDKKEPERVFHSGLHYVHDFEIEDNRLVLISFTKTLRKDPRLTLCNLNETILDEIPLPSKPIALYRDFGGRIFVEYENKVELIQIIHDKLSTVEVDANEYHLNLKPCRDSVSQNILFSDQIWFLPRFNYMAYDTRDSLVFLLREIVHEKVNHMMRWTYYEMKIDDQRKARQIADHFPELDKQEVAGLMTGFHNSIYYEQPYVPLFVQNDTILIFDHCADFVYRYTKNLETIDSVQIKYHKPKKRWTWKNQVYFDEPNGVFYGLFRENGYSYLRQLDLTDGCTSVENKLQNQFVEKIRVYNGYVYYVYKPANSPIKPYIFRELLSVN